MKKLLLLSFLVGLGVFIAGSASAQCVELGSPVGELSPLVKDNGAFCPTPAQATNVCDCPTGYVAVGYEGLEGNSYGAMVLSQFSLRCRQLNLDGTLGATVDVTCSNGTDIGNSVDGPADAAAGEALVGFEVRLGCAMDGIQGYGKPIADIAAGTANSTSNAVTAIGGMGGSAQPVMYVPDGNVIVGMQTYEDPGNNIVAGVAWRYAPINSVPCPSGCTISSISFANASACNDNGTDDIAYDDYFTADVTVSYVNTPATGTLNLTGPNVSESVAVGSIGASSYTFTGVQMPSTGGSIFLSASFSADAGCTFTGNAGTSPATCSPNATGIPTMSEWGLILFALIMLTLSVVFGTQYKQSMAMANGAASGSSRTKLPFDAKAYLNILPWIYVAIVALFAISIFVFGYVMTTADIPGSLMAGAVIAYLVYYIKQYSRG